jgi:hypothetical protein
MKNFRFAVTAGLLLASAGEMRAEPGKVSCKAERQAFDVYDAKTKQTTEHESWRVVCSVKRGTEEIYSGPLALPYPATFRDAMDAIETFRKEKAPEILKGKK